jgi:bifunctional DNase/RNase
MVEMELVGVRVELPTNNPIVLLREVEGDRRLLPIFIGGPEATAIAYALENLVPPRPQTHDLMKNLLDELGARVRRIEVTELVDHTFYAEIELETGGKVHRISSRPSDAIALAVRIGAQIFASEEVLDEAGHVPTEEPEEENEEVVAEFREFIESVNPEDFAS